MFSKTPHEQKSPFLSPHLTDYVITRHGRRINMSENHFWSFGFGSNMDVHFVEKTKEVEVLEHTPAVLRGYRLSFSFPGYPLVEPAFGNLREDPEAETHGVAFRMSRANRDRMVQVEPDEYGVRDVDLEAYDGRRLRGFIFIANNPDLEEFAPSKRYLGIILDGARRAGLCPDYLRMLERHPTYSPPDWVHHRVRRARPRLLSELPPITVEELAQHKGDEDAWFSVMGYVVRPVEPGFFKSFRGRDITATIYLHYKQLAWYGSHEDDGRPPYPLLRDMSEEDLEYLTQFLDYYHAGSSPDGLEAMGQIVGHLVEFRQQQESGITTWKKPQKKQE